MRIGALACTAAAAVAVVAGCGGGGSKHLTLRDWASKANGICTDTQKKLEAAGPVPTQEPDIPGYLDKAIPIERGKLQRIEALGLPPGQESRARLVISVEKQIISLSEQLKRAAIADNPPKVGRLSVEVKAKYTEAGHLFSLIGASRCFSESS